MNKYIIIPVIAAAIVLGSLSGFYLLNNNDSSSEVFETTLDYREIGILIPTSGDFATHGNENFIAANMAISDFNEHLEKLNKNWRLNAVNVNSETDPEISLERTKELHAENIRIIIGPETSAELATIKPFVDSNEMFILSPTSTAPSLAVKDNIYRLAPDDTNQGNAITALLKENEIQAVILITRDDTWGTDLSTSITNSFIGNKIGDASLRILYNPEAPHFPETIKNTALLIADLTDSYNTENIAVVLLGFGESTDFLKDANSSPLLNDVKWFGTDSNANEQKIIDDEDALKFANKVDFTAVQFGTLPNDIRDDVESRMIDEIGRLPSTYAYSSYDAVWIVGQSILKTDSTDPEMIHDVFEEVASEYMGALGDVELNEAGDLKSANYDVWKIVDNEWKVTGYYDHVSDKVLQLK